MNRTSRKINKKQKSTTGNNNGKARNKYSLDDKTIMEMNDLSEASLAVDDIKAENKISKNNNQPDTNVTPPMPPRTSRRTSKPKMFENCIVYETPKRRTVNSEITDIKKSPNQHNQIDYIHNSFDNTPTPNIEKSSDEHKVKQLPKYVKTKDSTLVIPKIENSNSDDSNFENIINSSNTKKENELDKTMYESINNGELNTSEIEINLINQSVNNEHATNLNNNSVVNNQSNNPIQVKRRGRPRKPAVPASLPVSENEYNQSSNTPETNASITSAENDTHKAVFKREKRSNCVGGKYDAFVPPDIDCTPRVSLRPTEFNGEYTTVEIDFIHDSVNCGKCGVKLTKPQWKKHNLNKHNNMGWLEGTEPPNYESNEKLWKSVLLSAHKQKRGTLICDKCSTAKRSVVGFISHYRFCGKSEEEKEALMWTCPICRGIFKPSSQEIHERMHRDAERQLEVMKLQLEPTVILEEYDGKRKRKAAEKAATKISEFTELVQDKELPSKKIKKTGVESLIKPPQLKKYVPSVWKNNWMRDLAADKPALCRQPGCTYAASTLNEIFDHHSGCNFTPQKAFICRVCKLSSEKLEEIKEHVKQVHPEKIKDEDSDYNDKNRSDDSEEDERNNQMRIRKSFKQMQCNDMSKYTDHALFLTQAPFFDFGSVSNTYIPTIKWTIEFQIKNYQLTLFESLKPNFMSVLKNSDAVNYMPKVMTSMRIQKPKILINEAIDKNEKAYEWKEWRRFESSVVQNVPTFFVGGPIWAIAWLPIPAPMYSNKVNQFVAVSTHPSMDSSYVVGKSYKFMNIIQIWNLGHLTQDEFTPNVPKLSYSIAHETGTIWCMEWCPSGTYGHSSVIGNEKPENLKQRMGLLATASSDGCVHIYSLPFPEALNFSTYKGHDLPIYKTDPVLTLHVNKLFYNSNKVDWQCLNISWSKLFGHDTIAAGLSNGYIAVWNLTTNSPLIVTKQGYTLHMNACKHFYAHGQAVTYTGIIPVSDNKFLATTSLDRCTKIWDLEDISNPIQNTKKGVAVNGAWLTNWVNVFTSYDDVLGLGHNTTYMLGLRESSNKSFPLLPSNSVAYGLAVSDFANGVCHGTLAGEIAAIFPFQLFYSRELDKVTKKRWLVSSTEIVDLEESTKENKTSDTQKDKKRKSRPKDHQYMPETYEKCASRFGIVFHDDLNNIKDRRPKKFERRNPLNSENMNIVPIEQYQFSSINRIAWNPNAWSYSWIAVGYQNGLVRILNLKFISSQASMKLLPDVSKVMLEKANEQQCSVAS